MKNGFVKILALCMAMMVMIAAFSACGGSDKSADTTAAGTTAAPSASQASSAAEVKAPSPVTLKIYLFGDNTLIKNIDPIVAEFESRTAATLNTKLNINYYPISDYKDKMRMMISAGEEMDLVFDAPWLNLMNFGPQGIYMDLEKYFNNDEYPGLKNAFPADFLENNKFFEKQIAIPITDTFMDMEGAFYRADLLEKYGMQPIQSLADMTAFLQKVKENEKGITPMGAASGMFRIRNANSDIIAKAGVFSVAAGWGDVNTMYVTFSADGKQLVSMACAGEDASAFANFPAPYNTDQSALDKGLLQYAEWNQAGYFDKDAIVQKEADSQFLAGKCAAQEGTIGAYASKLSNLQKAVPGAKLGFFAFNDDQRATVAGAKYTDFKAWNDLCIPSTSKNADRSMKFIDWVFSSQENNDLFSYGITGQNWEPVGDKEWKYPEGIDTNNNYTFPKFEMTWNPNFIRLPSDLPAEVKTLTQYQYKFDTFTKTPLAGFTFDDTKVKTEIAKVSAVNEKYSKPLRCGLYKDVAGTLKKMNAEAKKAGMEKIKDEVKAQLEKFLASK